MCGNFEIKTNIVSFSGYSGVMCLATKLGELSSEKINENHR